MHLWIKDPKADMTILPNGKGLSYGVTCSHLQNSKASTSTFWNDILAES